ncbi:hypothetical protein BGW38_009714, partial [Lunasporangiospora selenospora]
HEYVVNRIQSKLSKGKSKEETFQSLFVPKRLPTNIKKSIFDAVQSSNDAAKNLSKSEMDRKLGDDGTVCQWNSYINTDFQSLWETEEQEYQIKRLSKKKGRADMDNDKGNSRDRVSDGDGDDGGGNEVERAVDPTQRELRTCTATLDQILRPDLCNEDKHRIQSLLEDGQETMTVLSRKYRYWPGRPST